ncbi:MAG: PIN domain-containing protein [Chloroflexota bacterium]
MNIAASSQQRISMIYLDYNCFQRGFDDPRQVRIQMEALACQEIFLKAERGQVRLIWSFMHEDETLLCPFPERKYEVLRLATLCQMRVGPEENIREIAQSFQKQGNLSAKDALHLACASYARAEIFLTCDDNLIKQIKRLNLTMNVMNPVDYIRQEIG